MSDKILETVEWVSEQALHLRIGVPLETIRDWRYKGKLHGLWARPPGTRRILYDVRAVNEWINQGRTKAA